MQLISTKLHMYEARGNEASEISDPYEARDNEASEEKTCMKPNHCVATEKKKVLKAVHKQLKAEEAREYAAKGEEASEMKDSQECILSGGVYLRHRLEK